MNKNIFSIQKIIYLTLVILMMSTGCYYFAKKRINQISENKILEARISESMKETSQYNLDDFSTELLTTAYSLIKQEQKKDDRVSSFIKLAEAYHKFGQHSEALLVVKEAVKQTNNIEDYYIKSINFNAIANYHLKYNNKTRAIKLLDRALDAAKEIIEIEGVEFSLSEIGLSYAESPKTIDKPTWIVLKHLN